MTEGFGGRTRVVYYVEDDNNIRELAVYALSRAGIEVEGVADDAEFRAACARRLPDVVILDIMLPGVDGLDMLRRIRQTPGMSRVPVMMVTAKSTELDIVTALDNGADEYMTKPYGMMELVSRVNALLRRAGAPAAARDELTCGPVVLTVSAHTVSVGGQPVALTLKEFDLLRALMQNEGRVLSRRQLLEDVWGVTYVGETRTVDVHVQTLRQKLAAASDGADALIQTVRGVGYCVKSPA